MILWRTSARQIYESYFFIRCDPVTGCARDCIVSSIERKYSSEPSLYDLATNVALSWELAADERGCHWNILIWSLSLLFSAKMVPNFQKTIDVIFKIKKLTSLKKKLFGTFFVPLFVLIHVNFEPLARGFIFLYF